MSFNEYNAYGAYGYYSQDGDYFVYCPYGFQYFGQPSLINRKFTIMDIEDLNMADSQETEEDNGGLSYL